MIKIFVTRKIPGEALSRLAGEGREVSVSEFDRPLSPEELIERARGADGVLSLLVDKIDGEVMDAVGPQLKIISNYAVGFDNVDVEAATERGIVVTNTPSDEVNEAVAEHAWALLMSLARRVVEADESTRRGSYKGWEPGIFLGTSLRNKTLGIVGLGRIGTMVAKKAVGFEMKVLYNKRSRDEKTERELGLEFAELGDLLGRSDFVSLHVPLTEETRHMINSETIDQMKDGAFLINTARGAVVREAELVDALRKGKIGAAALDVFDNEPNINPELISMENVILTPHIASATREARDKMGEQAVGAILDIFSDRKPENVVNREVWEKRRK